MGLIFIGMQFKLHIKYAAICIVGLGLWSCKHHKTIATTTKTPSKKTEIVKKPEPEIKKDDPETSDNNESTSIKKNYAAKLNVSESDIKNEKLYKFIDEWYAAPYKYGGKDKNGIDCSGFTGVLCSSIYNKKVSSSSKAIYEEVKKINSSDLKEGDLVFFIINGKNVSHVGVYLQHNKFVHASTKRGVIISDLDEPYYKKYFYSAGRIK